MRQISFSFKQNYKKEFGGSLLENKRKSQRPISTKNPLHLVLKSEIKNLFKPHNKSLEQLIKAQAKKWNIHLYDLALNWSHIHLLIQVKRREDYVKFIRSLTSLLAQKIKVARPHLKTIFTLRPFTRIISWGKDFQSAFAYVMLNQLEALGFVKREKKNRKIKKLIKSKLSTNKPKS